MEIWRSVSVNQGYEVSSLGNVRSVNREVPDKNGKIKRYKGKALRPGPGGRRHDYLSVSLGRDFHVAVHTLVCTAFHGQRPSKYHEVAHLDGDGHNNKETNLWWKTKVDNETDKVKHGTRTRGENHGPAKMKEADVIAVRRMLANGSTLKEAAAAFGTTIYNAYVIKSRRSWAWLMDDS